MFLMYVNECGDTGMAVGSSDYFMLSALVVHESRWTDMMASLAKQRVEFWKEYGLPMDLEIHAGEMMGRMGKKYSGIGKVDRLMMLRHTIALESTMTNWIRILNVVVDKRSKTFGYDVFATAWDTLINRFESTIEYGNFPAPSGRENDSGLLIVDETDEPKLRALIRKMRHDNNIPSKMFAGTTVSHNLKYVIEDPLHKQSDTSLAIQTCDVNSYFLKQSIEPNATIKKHGAKNLFYKLGPVLLKQASRTNENGIVFR